jgi:hypothetical protein
MKRITALLVGALVATGMAVVPAQLAAAGSDTVTGTDWSISVTVPDLTWTNGLACQKVPVTIHVEGAVTGWAVYLAGMKATATKPTMELLAEGTTPGDFPFQMSGKVCPTLRAMGTYAVAGAVAVEINGAIPPEQVIATTFTAGSPTPLVKAKGVSGLSKLKVDVNPSAGKKAWTFQVQEKQADGSWVTLPKVYKTLASSEKRTVNLPEGTYRAMVLPKFGFAEAYSPEVYLKR